MTISTKKLFLLLLLATPILLNSQRLSVGVTGGVNDLRPLLDWNAGIIKEDDVTDANDETIIHYGVTGKLNVHERLFLRSDLFYRRTVSSFSAQYKVVNDLWTSAGKLEMNTINWMVAPQLHFFPRNFAYVYAGFLLEINTGADFTEGTIYKSETMTTTDFKDDDAQNNSASAIVAGLGIHPRFNRFGIFAEIRYSRSKPTAVHPTLPRIGQENICFGGGITYDIFE